MAEFLQAIVDRKNKFIGFVSSDSKKDLKKIKLKKSLKPYGKIIKKSQKRR